MWCNDSRVRSCADKRQAHWRRRLDAFIADGNNRTTSGKSPKNSSGRFKLGRLAARKSGKRGLQAVGTENKTVGWR